MDIGTFEGDIPDYSIANFRRAEDFMGKVKEQLGFDFQIDIQTKYNYPGFVNEEEHTTVLLGSTILLDKAKVLIRIAREFFPKLKYISLLEGVPTTYIGSSTEGAKNNDLKNLNENDFDQLLEFDDIESFHRFIKLFM